MLERWYNPLHGLELEPDINMRQRGNENGVLFLVELMIILDMIHGSKHNLTKSLFESLVPTLRTWEEGQQVDGLYDRGKDESKLISLNERRTISHDNITAISSGAKLLGLPYSEHIYKYGLHHFGIYNNCKPIRRLPMNPSNFCIWSYNGGNKLLSLLFLPIYLVSMLISLCKPKGQTSGKLLYFVELYPVRNEFVFKILWKVYVGMMRLMYGNQFLKELTSIYFKHPEHPVRVNASYISFENNNTWKLV